MKLKRFRFERVGPFRDVTMNIGDYTVVVGRNGSGKTFMFEALDRFFSEFDVTSGPSTWMNTDYCWHRRDTSKPLAIEVSLALSHSDVDKLSAASGDQDSMRSIDESADWDALEIRR